MTPVVDWRELFTAEEAALYGVLLDEEADAWHIYELIDAAGLQGSPVEGGGLRALAAPLRDCLVFIDEVLRRHPQVVPAVCLREGRYPWIRQRRDVHQFDVGSHLACCCALAVRGVGGATARDGGGSLLAEALDADLARSIDGVMPAAAVFHDLFKCFRPRRPLPAKLGPKQSINWAPPHWSQAQRQDLDDDEVPVAVRLLPELLGGSETLEEVLRCLRRSEERSRSSSRRCAGSPGKGPRAWPQGSGRIVHRASI